MITDKSGIGHTFGVAILVLFVDSQPFYWLNLSECVLFRYFTVNPPMRLIRLTQAEFYTSLSLKSRPFQVVVPKFAPGWYVVGSGTNLQNPTILQNKTLFRKLAPLILPSTSITTVSWPNTRFK